MALDAIYVNVETNDRVRRGNADNLNGTAPFELGGLAPSGFTLRRRKFTGKCFANHALML